MIKEKGIYRCQACGKSFSKRRSGLVPIEFTNAMKLRSRIENAETSYRKALEILSNLDNIENRKYLAKVLRKERYRIEPGDFEGARLEMNEQAAAIARSEFFRQYGLRGYPLTILISPEKCHEVMKKMQSDPNVAFGGINVRLTTEPFGALGGIRLSFRGMNKAMTLHENMHGTERIYKGEGPESSYNFQKLLAHAEAYMLDEINSYRTETESGNKTPESVKAYWDNRIRDLSGVYLKKFIWQEKEWVSKKILAEIEKSVTYGLNRLIPIIADLQLRYGESVLSRILIKSRTFADVEAWSKRKDILDQWQKRAGGEAIPRPRERGWARREIEAEIAKEREMAEERIENDSRKVIGGMRKKLLAADEKLRKVKQNER